MTGRRVARVILLTLLGAFVAIQFVRPARTNPSVEPAQGIFAQSQVPPPVADVLQRSCFDCHSDQTRWPWYSHVAPVSWLVARDVHEARRELNFSRWSQYDPAKAAKKLGAVADEVREGHMPLPIYLWIHRDAKLTRAEIDALGGWADGESARLGLGGTDEGGSAGSVDTADADPPH